MKSYNNTLIELMQDLDNWDSKTKALKEAFDTGIDYQKKVHKEAQE